VYSSEQQVKLYIANPDFEFIGKFGAPRLTSGAFLLLLKSLYKEKTRKELQYTVFGKPFHQVYEYAIKLFANYKFPKLPNSNLNTNTSSVNSVSSVSGGSNGSSVKFSSQTKIYAVGDNPLSDIKGANDAKWNSILVRTGVWQEPNKANDTDNPAKYVCANVLEAVNLILQQTNTNS